MSGSKEVTILRSTKDDGRPPAEVCRERGWGPGTLLAGDEGYGVTVIEIVCVHDRNIYARTVAHDGLACGGGESSWVLYCRDWQSVDPTEVPQPIPVGTDVRTSQGTEGTVESGPDRQGAYVVAEPNGKKWMVPAKHLQSTEYGSDGGGS